MNYNVAVRQLGIDWQDFQTLKIAKLTVAVDGGRSSFIMFSGLWPVLVCLTLSVNHGIVKYTEMSEEKIEQLTESVSAST